jgi:hypothetical protein
MDPGPTPHFTASAPGDDLDVEPLLDAAHHRGAVLVVAVRHVDDEHVRARLDERLGALHRVRADADRGADAQPPLLVLRRVRVLDALLDVLHGDEPAQAPVGVDDRELLDLVPPEDRARLLERRPDRRRHEAAARHQRRNRLLRVAVEAEVAVREDADEALVVRDRPA